MDLEFKYWNKDNILDIIINKKYNEKILILEKFIGWYSNNLHFNMTLAFFISNAKSNSFGCYFTVDTVFLIDYYCKTHLMEL